jgi:putative ABC transport system ATP-binding protein
MTNGANQTAVIELRKVQKVYRTGGEIDVRAVQDLSLTIRRGEFVAIMGSSGSGKSTLLNIIGCLDQPTGGAFLLDGVDVSQLSRRELSVLRNRKLGFVFQNFNLLARTSGLENVELPMLYSDPLVSGRLRRERAARALEKVGLGQSLRHTPNQLSGGQQQRIAIARALVNEPQIVLADEPTGNLDSRTSIEIMGIFQELNDAGITLVMVTHELDIAAYCGRIVVMRDGRVISDTANPRQTRARQAIADLERAEQAAKIS